MRELTRGIPRRRIGLLIANEEYERTRSAGAPTTALAHSLERHQKTVSALSAAIDSMGHEPVPIFVDGSLSSRLDDARVDLVFNTYFGPARRQDQAHVAALLEYAGVRFTGGGAACHFLGLSKPLSKQIFAASRIATAPFFVAGSVEEASSEEALAGIGFPLIVKTSAEGEGIGLDDRSVVRSPGELARAVERVVKSYGEAALVERYLSGREFTVGVLDGNPPKPLPILELLLGEAEIYSYDAKVSAKVGEICPAILEESAASAIRELAVRAGRAVGCRDYWRVDFRMDLAGTAYVLEVNTLPGLQPGYSDFPKTAEAAGLSYEELVGAILATALARP